jgi:hypothetical protein
LDLCFGRELSLDSGHFDVIRTSMTRNIGKRFPDVHEEMVAAFNDHIPAKGDGKQLIESVKTFGTDGP